MTLSGSAQIGTNSAGYTLTNNSTIQGTGLIGSNVGSLYDNDNLTNGGTIVSNGGTLTLAGTGTLTNTGTLHATAGTTLVSTMSGLSSSTFSQCDAPYRNLPGRRRRDPSNQRARKHWRRNCHQ